MKDCDIELDFAIQVQFDLCDGDLGIRFFVVPKNKIYEKYKPYIIEFLSAKYELLDMLMENSHIKLNILEKEDNVIVYKVYDNTKGIKDDEL